MSLSQRTRLERLHQREAQAKTALDAKRKALALAQHSLKKAEDAARLRQQQALGQLVEEAGLGTLAVPLLRQVFTTVAALASDTQALEQWLAGARGSLWQQLASDSSGKTHTLSSWMDGEEQNPDGNMPVSDGLGEGKCAIPHFAMRSDRE